MGKKLLWTGLTFVVAVVPGLAAFGLQANNALILVGAILMVIGLVLYLLDK